MELSKKLLIIVGVTILIFGGIFVLSLQEEPHKTVKMFATISEVKVLGLNSDTDALYFGSFPENGIQYSEKKLYVVNDFEVDKRVELVPKGNISSWITFSENNYILEPHEVSFITLKATPPKNATVGDYSGELWVYLRKV